MSPIEQHNHECCRKRGRVDAPDVCSRRERSSLHNQCCHHYRISTYAGETSNVANENYKLDSCFILNTLSFRVIA